MNTKVRMVMSVFAVLLLVFSLIGCTTVNTTSSSSGSTETTKSAETSTTITTAATSQTPEYLNLESELPIIKDGHDIKLTVAVPQNEGWGNAEDIWLWEFIRQSMNIDIEVIQSMDMATYKSLAFAGGELPDFFMGCRFSTAEQILYGSQEGQLIDLTPWINATYMPYLSQFFAENPSVKNMLTAPDGGMYCFGYVEGAAQKALQSSTNGLYINSVWLSEAGLDSPQTLDEFSDMLRAFRSKGNDVVPLGGSSNYVSFGFYLLNALGYNTVDSWGLSPALRNGKAVIPCGDREAFGEYLKIMNQLYSEGLIEQDYFTIESNVVSAKVSQKLYGALGQVTYIFLSDDSWKDWEAANPLTSDWNQTKQWPSHCADLNNPSVVVTGGMVVTSACEYPDVAARFADWFFEPTSCNYNLTISGPTTEMAKKIGYGKTNGWTMEEGSSVRTYVDADEGQSAYQYQLLHIMGVHGGASIGNGLYYAVADQVLAGLESDVTTIKAKLNPENADDFWRMSLIEHCIPYCVSGYPIITYFDEKQSQAINDYKTLITDYVMQETAKFTTGLRPLSELNAYFDELDAMGFQEWQQYYIDYYNLYQSK